MMTKNFVEKYIDQQDLMTRVIQIACDRVFSYKVNVRWVAYVKPAGIGDKCTGVMCMYKDDAAEWDITVSYFPVELLVEIADQLTENAPEEPIYEAYRVIREQNVDLANATVELRRQLATMTKSLSDMYSEIAKYKPTELVPNEYRDLINKRLDEVR